MSEASRREEAFRSALGRLPMAVIIVDGQRCLQAYNPRGAEFFDSEGLRSDLIESRPQHPLSMLVGEILTSPGEPVERTLTFPSGKRFRVEPSRRSEKGTGGWLMLLVSAATDDAGKKAELDALGLTPREREVAERLLAGERTDDICAALSIRRDTLKTHTRRLFEKSGTRSRAELVAKLLKPR